MMATDWSVFSVYSESVRVPDQINGWPVALFLPLIGVGLFRVSGILESQTLSEDAMDRASDARTAYSHVCALMRQWPRPASVPVQRLHWNGGMACVLDGVEVELTPYTHILLRTVLKTPGIPRPYMEVVEALDCSAEREYDCYGRVDSMKTQLDRVFCRAFDKAGRVFDKSLFFTKSEKIGIRLQPTDVAVRWGK